MRKPSTEWEILEDINRPCQSLRCEEHLFISSFVYIYVFHLIHCVEDIHVNHCLGGCFKYLSMFTRIWESWTHADSFWFHLAQLNLVHFECFLFAGQVPSNQMFKLVGSFTCFIFDVQGLKENSIPNIPRWHPYFLAQRDMNSLCIKIIRWYPRVFLI